MLYEQSDVTNNELFSEQLPEVLKHFAIHKQIYSEVTLSTFLMSLKSKLESNSSENNDLEWEEMTRLVEYTLFSPDESNVGTSL